MSNLTQKKNKSKKKKKKKVFYKKEKKIRKKALYNLMHNAQLHNAVNGNGKLEK